MFEDTEMLTLEDLLHDREKNMWRAVERFSVNVINEKNNEDDISRSR